MDPHFRVLCKLLTVHNQWSSSITASCADDGKGRKATHEDEANSGAKYNVVHICTSVYSRTAPLSHDIKGRFTHSMPFPCRAAKGLECVFSI